MASRGRARTRPTRNVVNGDVQNATRDQKHWISLDLLKFFCVLAGAYGIVYRARDTSGRYVALKKIRISLTSDGIPMTTLREISLLKNLDSYNHPHIVK